jgi:competence protein ComEC
MSLIYFTLAWVLGILVAWQTTPKGSLILAILVFAVLNVLVFWRERPWRLVFGMLLMFGLGMLRLENVQPENDQTRVMHYNDRGRLTIRGLVIAEPLLDDEGLQLLVETQQAAGQQVHGRVLAEIPRYSEIHYGDEVQLFGTLRSPAEFDTFSYQDYLARQGVFSVMYNAEVEPLSTGKGSRIYAELLDLKDRARRFITRSLPEPQASLLVGILLGDESGISEDTRTNFTRTGTSHIIAISGFNMAIVAGVVMGILDRVMPKRGGWAAFIGILMIAIYTIFVGASPSVVRAAIMSSMLILGKSLFRKTYVPTSLAFVTLVMSAVDPWVLWDVGFQLSLGAVMGMALFVPPMERFFWRVAGRFIQGERWLLNLLSESILVTLAAQITTTPIILLYFGRLSLVSLLVNFLIIPVQTPLLLTGAVGTLIGMVFPQGGELVLQSTWVFLSWTTWIVEAFADLSWADTELSLGKTAVIGFFLALGVFMLYRATRPRWARQLVAGVQVPVYLIQGTGIIALILLVSAIRQQPDGHLRVTFLDADNSNSVLIQSPKGGVILVDGGRFPTRLLDLLGNQLPARSHRIDVLIVTSPDEDNIAALPEVLERYSVGVILTNGQISLDANFAALMDRIGEQGISLVPVVAGYTLTTDDGVRVDVLNPMTRPADDAEPETAGLVLRLTYEKATFLLTGDITAPTEQNLLAHNIQAGVLQIPAHGSGDASSSEFIQAVNPQVAVLQVDETLPPSPTVIDRLSSAQLFRTDQQGTIEIVTDGHQLWVNPENPSER